MNRTSPAVAGIFKYDTPGGKHRWGVDYRDPHTRLERRKAGFLTRHAADAFRATKEALLLAIDRGEIPSAETLTFGDLVTRFLRDYRPRSGSTAYYDERSRVWLAHIPAETMVHAVTPALVDALKRDRLAEVSASTVRKDLVSLSTLFRWAGARHLAVLNPADPGIVGRPPKAPADPHPLSDQQVEVLLDACPGWLALVVELAILTGADRAELVGLTWRDIDKQRCVIRIPRGKTGVGRAFPYRRSAAIRRVLAAAGKVRHTSGRVFLGPKAQPMTVNSAKKGLRRAWAKSLGDWPRQWKTLRATFATTMLIDRGRDVPTVAALMGLTSAHVLDFYAKPSGAHLEESLADGP